MSVEAFVILWPVVALVVVVGVVAYLYRSAPEQHLHPGE